MTEQHVTDPAEIEALLNPGRTVDDGSRRLLIDEANAVRHRIFGGNLSPHEQALAAQLRIHPDDRTPVEFDYEHTTPSSIARTSARISLYPVEVWDGQLGGPLYGARFSTRRGGGGLTVEAMYSAGIPVLVDVIAGGARV